MIGLATSTYDLNGALILKTALENPYQATRRGTVTATLDISSSVYDGGYAISDATYTAKLRHPSASLLTKLQYLVAYYVDLIASTEIGLYTARVAFTQRNDLLTLTVRLLTRLDS